MVSLKQKLPYALCLLFCWSGVFLIAVAEEEPAAAPQAEAVASGFELSIKAVSPAPAPDRASYIVTLKKNGSAAATSSPMREALLWWTTPGGWRTSIVMKSIDEGLWANLVELAPEPGQHRLSLLLVGESADAAASAIIEQAYTLILPEARLTREREERLNAASAPAAPAASKATGEDELKEVAAKVYKEEVGAPKKAVSTFSLPLVVILVGLFNLVLALAGAFCFAVWRRLPLELKERLTPAGAGSVGEGPDSQSLKELFVQAGMIAAENGAPLTVPEPALFNLEYQEPDANEFFEKSRQAAAIEAELPVEQTSVAQEEPLGAEPALEPQTEVLATEAEPESTTELTAEPELKAEPQEENLEASAEELMTDLESSIEVMGGEIGDSPEEAEDVKNSLLELMAALNADRPGSPAREAKPPERPPSVPDEEGNPNSEQMQPVSSFS